MILDGNIWGGASESYPLALSALLVRNSHSAMKEYGTPSVLEQIC